MSHTNTILFLNADPVSDQKSRWEEEFREVQYAYERSAERKEFTLKSRWAVRIADLRRGLLDEEPRVLHISGRNTGNGIMFENNRGEINHVAPAALSNLLGLFEDCLEWVILSGCFDEIQASGISDVIPNVIGLDLDPKARMEASLAIYDTIMAGNEDPKFVANLAKASASMTSDAGGVYLFQRGEQVDLSVNNKKNVDEIPDEELIIPPPSSDRISDIHTFFCDRTVQNQEFFQLFSEESHFHFFGIHGNDPQSHRGLFNRFYHNYLSDPDQPEKAPAYKIVLRQALNLEAYKAEIRSKIITELRVNRRVARLPEMRQMNGIAEAMSHRQAHTVAIEFRVRSSYWKPFTTQLLQWFVHEYCQLKEADESLPVFYFFFSVIYEEKVDHEIMVSNIREMLPQLPGCVILSELLPVTRGDIRDWIDNYITSNSQRQEKLLKKYFPEKRERYDMAEVELRLDALIKHEPPDTNKI